MTFEWACARADTFGGMSQVVRIATDEHIATITIDRAPVNALPPEGWIALREQIEQTASDVSIRAVIITGGPGRFCAGADISSLTEPSDEPDTMLRLVADVAQSIHDHRVPVIAAIDGPAHGGGLELALACDIRVSSAAATFAASGVNMGLVASVRSLMKTIGPTHARTMLLTGDRIDAATADRWGLISDFDEHPIDRAIQLAQRIAGKAPLAIEATKRALNAVDSSSAVEHDSIMSELFRSLAQSADHSEAIGAFLEKRPPGFTRS